MPEMDGFEATAQIRQKEQRTGGHIPIIAMTAHAMPGDDERCRSAGMDNYITKPASSAALLEMVASMALRGPHPTLWSMRGPLPKKSDGIESHGGREPRRGP